MAVSFLGLRTCIYRVPDLATATKWYSNALGIKPYFDMPFYVGFNVGGYELGLQPLPALAEVTTSNKRVGSIAINFLQKPNS